MPRRAFNDAGAASNRSEYAAASTLSAWTAALWPSRFMRGSMLERQTRSVDPDHDPAPRGEQHDDAERDAVPRERHEGVGRDVAQQPAHAQEGEEERGVNAAGQHAEVAADHHRALFE